jgi:hypothetical protein
VYIAAAVLLLIAMTFFVSRDVRRMQGALVAVDAHSGDSR